MHFLRHESGVVLPADFGAVPHHLTDFVEADALLGKVTAEGVTVEADGATAADAAWVRALSIATGLGIIGAVRSNQWTKSKSF